MLVTAICLLFLLWPLLGENGLPAYFQLRKQREDVLCERIDAFCGGRGEKALPFRLEPQRPFQRA